MFRLTSGASVCFVHKSAFLAPVEGSAPEKRFLVSHSSDSSWFKWTLLVEMVLLVHLAQRSCQSCSWPARNPILPGLADALGICSLCTAQPSLHTGSPQFCPLGQSFESHSSPNADATGKLGWVNLLPSHTQVHFAI